MLLLCRDVAAVAAVAAAGVWSWVRGQTYANSTCNLSADAHLVKEL